MTSSPGPRTRTVLSIITTALVLVAWAAPADATWSIVVVDEDSGRVGVAIASCVPVDVLGRRGEVVVPVLIAPGTAAGVVQATADPDRITMARQALADRTGPQATLDLVLGGDDSADLRQYGFVSLLDEGEVTAPVVVQHTGVSVEEPSGHRRDGSVSVQGVLLGSDQVLDATLAQYLQSEADGLPMEQALAQALAAGSRAGGDRRCGDQTALFAQLVVARAFDDVTSPEVLVTTAVDEGDGQNPVILLADTVADGNQQGWFDTRTDRPVGVPRLAVLVFGLVLAAASVVVLRAGLGSTSARRTR